MLLKRHNYVRYLMVTKKKMSVLGVVSFRKYETYEVCFSDAMMVIDCKIEVDVVCVMGVELLYI